YSLKIGYDPEFASFSPSNLLKYLMMQEAFDIGLTESHFLGTDDEWKLNWTKHTDRQSCLSVYPPSLLGRYLHWAKFRMATKLHHHRYYKALRKTAVVIMGIFAR